MKHAATQLGVLMDLMTDKLQFSKVFFGLFLLAIVVAGCKNEPQGGSTMVNATPTRTQIKLPTAEQPSSTPSPSIMPTRTPNCDMFHGELERTEYMGVVEVEDIRVVVYLPPCYSTDSRDYPVVYLLHGYPLDENHWLELGVVETVEEGYKAGLWPHFMIVLPQIPNQLNVNSDGGENSYEQEFIEGLIPYIEGKYRIRRGAEYSALAGVSRGGVWALEIGLHNEERFGTVAALSPALHVNHPRPAFDPFYLIEDPAHRPDRLFLSAGLDEEGFRDKTLEFLALLESLNIPYTYLETQGGHVNSTWTEIMGDLIAFLTATW